MKSAKSCCRNLLDYVDVLVYLGNMTFVECFIVLMTRNILSTSSIQNIAD